ncbi:reprolysin-like metallopeptidase, partial [Aeromonas sp. MdU4]|uniref:reprolysin-like metallopeptidase n=1 Tax=Aeromonas sp. MdU4 TaxID=3342819 RepID=UPI0035B9DC28
FGQQRPHQGKTVFVDPLDNAEGYAVYYQHDAFSRLEEKADQVFGRSLKKALRQTHVSGNERKQYTIAISAASAYTRYHGGTKALATAAIATMLNRVNEVYERDVGVEFQLAEGNDSVIFTDQENDPFLNTSQDMNLNVQVQNKARNEHELGAFDIGHVVNTNGGGVAILGSLCTGNRSRGMTGSRNPVGDAFFIDYVAHEIGHQMGADHTFNGTSRSCGKRNRNPDHAYEPGSGSSIMAYAGICGVQNLQPHTDPYFHSTSIDQMRAHMASVPDCGTTIPLTDNPPPQAMAGDDYTIPANTPFVLKGDGKSSDNAPLTYTWEELDLGAASDTVEDMVDDGSRPLFRFVPPTSSPERILPSLPSLLSNTLAMGEAWPTTNRNLNFRLTVRNGQGGVASDNMRVRVVDTGLAFKVTGPKAAMLTAGSKQNITWDVADTDLPPIACQKVDLFLTQNEGKAWSSLGSGLPNRGTATVTLPDNLANKIRFKVACSDNIFFALSGPYQSRTKLVGPLVSSNSIDAKSAPDTNGSSLTNVKTDASTDNSGGGGSFGFWGLALGLLAWQRRKA